MLILCGWCVGVQEKGGSLYKLTIDVMETKCHISSGKPWKQCEVRGIEDVPVSNAASLSNIRTVSLWELQLAQPKAKE